MEPLEGKEVPHLLLIKIVFSRSCRFFYTCMFNSIYNAYLHHLFNIMRAVFSLNSNNVINFQRKIKL